MGVDDQGIELSQWVSPRGRVVRVEAMKVEVCRWTRNRRVVTMGEGEKG